ncbi:MAG: phosphonoacetaldehyde hydrolase [Desulfovibrio sp.]|nr:phosphonoacetaldehyde hydrolase [Desulfovibrio sp.]
MKPFIRNRPYTGRIQAVILDWAGTAVDFGCFGPVAVFQAAFEHFGLAPTLEETREPMGIAKRDHVARMLAMPRISRQWQSAWGRLPLEEDIDAIYAKTLELMPGTLASHAEPVPGCGDALSALRDAGIKIGSCTGYTRPMMTELIPRARAAGFDPDCLVCSDEVPQGRPWPWMCWRNCENLDVFPPEAVVKAGDTVADIEEGLNAGCWSVGMVESSSGVGLAPEERAAMPADRLASLDRAQAEKLLAAGAHFVIAGMADLPVLCAKINALLAQGKPPGRGAANA